MKRFSLSLMLILMAGAVASQNMGKPARTMSSSLGLYALPADNQNAETLASAFGAGL